MKKMLAFMLCLTLVFCAAQAEKMVPTPGSPAEAWGKHAAGEILGFELLNILHSSGENTVLSPQSLTIALSMAAEGAQGNTLEEILGALDADELSGQVPDGIQSANAAFTAPGLLLKEDYIDKLNAGYGAQWFEIDGEVVNRVNSWVEENTNGLIEELLQDAPAADTGMILINAVAMDAKWQSPFAPQSTSEADFHAPAGDVKVEMMHQKAHFDYAEKDGFQIIRLPYADGGLEMWIALPEDGKMDALLEILAMEGMFYLQSDAQSREVILSLPKMDVADENSLTDAMKLLGLEKAFSSEADFSGISDTPLCIDDILQKARVQIDEDGTKAAAATALVMKAMAMMPVEEPVEMTVDRPFVFVISDSETGAVCFAGAIENPLV